MPTSSLPAVSESQTRQVEEAQAAYLGRCAPGYRTRRVRWAGGTTQLIELGDGPPLLLLHGGLGEAFQWGPILAPLARTHRVLAVDRPGHGLADPYDYRGVDLLDHARTFLEQILDAEKLESVPVVASSMGGLWAVSFAIAQPRRVSRLVLAGATAGITRALPLQMRLGTLPVLKGLIRDLMRKPTRDAVRAFWKQMLVAHPERLADDFLDLSAASQQRNVESWFTLIDQSYDFWGMRAQLLLGEHWKNLTVPTTFIWGDKDAFSPPEVGEAVVAANPRIRMVRIPDAGHAPWMDEPDKVLAAINGALA